MSAELKILDIINQLIAVDEVDWTNPREEHIRNLTPISNVSVGPSPPHDPEFSFYVGKETPKASKFSFDDMMTVIISEELYPLYIELDEVAFITKFNQIIYSHISKKLEEARERNVPDTDNIWMQPNTAFINWFHENNIEIDIQYLPTLLEMQNAYQSWINKVNKPVLKYFTDKYSKVFKECCRTIEIDRRFHDLRHTFAVRRYLITRDIYQVMKEMGHSKVTTTQIYSKFNTRRLEADFPTLVQSYHKTTKMDIVDTEMVDTKVVYSS